MNSSWSITFLILAIATAWDIGRRRIPNWLVLPYLAAGLVLGGMYHGLSGVTASLAGISVAIALVGPFCWLRGMGMGDLKLCAAVGAWIGPGQLLFTLVMTAIAGGIIAVGYAAWHGSLGRSLAGAGDLITSMLRGKSQRQGEISLGHPSALSMPYAPAIAIGTLFAFLAFHG